MAERQYRMLSKRTIDRLAVNGKDAVFWDHELPGFGVRVYPSGAKVYVVQTRAGGRSKRVRVGRHGDLSPDQARKEAARLIARLKAGEPLDADALPPTVADLAERYLREYVDVHNKPATAAHYRIMLGKHIVPALGALVVAEVERKDILALQYGLRDKPTVANRAVDMLVKMFNLAELWEMRPAGRNPCKAVRRYKVELHKERFLTPKELAPARPDARCGTGRAAGVAPRGRRDSSSDPDRMPTQRDSRTAVDGCELRRGRALAGRFQDGARIVPLPPAAADVLAVLPRIPDNPWVFPGKKRGTHQSNINDSWDRIRRRAGLDGVRLHDLRHTFASRALALGEGLPMIGELLGHRRVNTTARYAHLARESVRASTARVAESIGADILEE